MNAPKTILAAIVAALAADPEAVEPLLALLDDRFERVVRRVVADLAVGDAGDQLVDADTAAEILGTTAAALRRANERGKAAVAAIRVGKRLRWRKRDLQIFLAAQRAEAGR